MNPPELNIPLAKSSTKNSTKDSTKDFVCHSSMTDPCMPTSGSLLRTNWNERSSQTWLRRISPRTSWTMSNIVAGWTTTRRLRVRCMASVEPCQQEYAVNKSSPQQWSCCSLLSPTWENAGDSWWLYSIAHHNILTSNLPFRYYPKCDIIWGENLHHKTNDHNDKLCLLTHSRQSWSAKYKQTAVLENSDPTQQKSHTVQKAMQINTITVSRHNCIKASKQFL